MSDISTRQTRQALSLMSPPADLPVPGLSHCPISSPSQTSTENHIPVVPNQTHTTSPTPSQVTDLPQPAQSTTQSTLPLDIHVLTQTV